MYEGTPPPPRETSISANFLFKQNISEIKKKFNLTDRTSKGG